MPKAEFDNSVTEVPEFEPLEDFEEEVEKAALLLNEETPLNKRRQLEDYLEQRRLKAELGDLWDESELA